MIVQFINHHDRYLPGEKADVTRDRATLLCEILQVAVICEDQTRLDYTPEKKKQEEQQPQNIEVHNHYYQAEAESEKNTNWFSRMFTKKQK